MSKRKRTLQETNTVQLQEMSSEEFVEDTEEVTVSTNAKEEWIRFICKNGIPADLYEPEFSFLWQTKKVTLNVFDCDILKLYGYPFKGNERRADFAAPHYLGLATKKLYLPCTVDGKFSLEEFTARKGTELLNAYFNKLHEYIEDMNNLLRYVNELPEESVAEKYNEFISKYSETGYIKL